MNDFRLTILPVIACVLAVFPCIVGAQADHFYDDGRVYTWWEESVGFGDDVHVNKVARVRIWEVTPPFEDFAVAEEIGAASGSIINTTQGFYQKRSEFPLVEWEPWPGISDISSATITYATVIIGDVTNITINNATAEYFITNIFNATEAYIDNSTINNAYITNATVQYFTTNILNATEIYVFNEYITNAYITNVTQEIAVTNIHNVTKQYVVENYVTEQYITNQTINNLFETNNFSEIITTIYNALEETIYMEDLGPVDGVNVMFFTRYPIDADSSNQYKATLYHKATLDSPPMPIDRSRYTIYAPGMIVFNEAPIAYHPYRRVPLINSKILATYVTAGVTSIISGTN